MKTVGFDIGGTQLRAAIFDEARNMTDSYRTENDKGITAAFNMDKLIDFILSKPYQYKRIVIGCPGTMDIRLGKLLCPPNLIGWDGFEIVKYVEERTGICTTLNNDANLAGLAEARAGAGAGYESVVFMGISTGIGGAYVYQDKLVIGANSNAAEFWNMVVNDDSYCHKNANAGSLNEQSSGSGLQRIASETYGRQMSTSELFERYRRLDVRALKIIEDAAEKLAKGIGNITCTIDPDIIIIGGSVALHNPDFVEKILEKAKRYVLCPENLKVKFAAFGDDAGLIGAALLAEEG